MKKKNKKKVTAKQKAMWFNAVSENDIETVQKMLKEGIDVDCGDTPKWTALHFACFWKYADMIQLLINHGADINIQNDSLRTPLHVACCYGTNINITKLLIDNGADVNIRDKDGDTPFSLLKNHYLILYEGLMEWLTEHHPDKALEVIASENIQSKSAGL